MDKGRLMKEDRGDCCGTCLFWRGGECRRNPPVLHASFTPVGMEVHVYRDQQRGMWPRTGEGDWCGEWSMAPGADMRPVARSFEEAACMGMMRPPAPSS